MKAGGLSAHHDQNCQKDEKQAAVGPWTGEHCPTVKRVVGREQHCWHLTLTIG